MCLSVLTDTPDSVIFRPFFLICTSSRKESWCKVNAARPKMEGYLRLFGLGHGGLHLLDDVDDAHDSSDKEGCSLENRKWVRRAALYDRKPRVRTKSRERKSILHQTAKVQTQSRFEEPGYAHSGHV